MIERVLHNNLFQITIKFVAMWAVLFAVATLFASFHRETFWYQFFATSFVQLYFLYKKQPMKVNFLYLTFIMICALFVILGCLMFLGFFTKITIVSGSITSIAFYALLYMPTYVYLLAFISKKIFKIISIILIILTIMSIPAVVAQFLLPDYDSEYFQYG